MALYEHTFLIRQDASPQEVEALTEEMKSLIETAGGKVTKTEQWGIRSLTYRMQKNRKAHYTFLNIEAPWEALAEMERRLKLNEDVLRYLTIRVDEHEEGPSAILQRRDRDEERGDRGFGDRGGFGGGDRDRGERRFPRRDNDNQDAEKTERTSA